MNAEYIKNNYTTHLLTDKLDLSNFSCNSESLNKFLKEDALREQGLRLNVTHLIMCNGEIIGFFSLANDSVDLKDLNTAERKKFEQKSNYKKIPSIKVCRFAIDKKYEGKGLGSFFLIKLILWIIFLSIRKIGIRFITVDGYANAYEFYRKNNFKYLKASTKDVEKIDKVIRTNPEKPILLYLDINSILKS